MRDMKTTKVNIRCIYKYDSLLFFGARTSEVFLSKNYGNTWTVLNNEPTGVPVLSLTVFEDCLYANICIEGSMKYPLSMILGNDGMEIKADYLYPNPLNNNNNNVTIAPNKMSFNSYLTVYNITGQKLIKKKIKEETTNIDLSS
jgi:hypothetical protein